MKPKQVNYHSRSIRLENYDYSSAGAYFITFCTFDRSCYFSKFLQLREIVEEHWLDIPVRFPDVVLDEYVLMPNHLHAILTIDSGRSEATPRSGAALGAIIGSFKSLCVTAWLKEIKRHNVEARGRFWQDNYYEHVVRNEAELERIREYIRNNPIQWELDSENPANAGAVVKMPERWMV